MGVTTEDIEYYIKKLMDKNNIKSYKINKLNNLDRGFNYLGEISFLTVTTDCGKTYDLVLKTAKISPEVRKNDPIGKVYDREIYLYSKVFPIFREFQMKKKIKNPFKQLPKCYMVFNEVGKEALILRNLTKRKYILYDQLKPMNFEHSLFVFQNYGRFHALSMALHHQNPELFKTLSKDLKNIFSEGINEKPDFHLKMFNDAVELLKYDHPNAYQKLLGYGKEAIECFTEKFDTPEPCFVITQGDCWNNNFLFKYENDNKIPSDMVFLDFQLSFVGWPVYDLSYFLYTTANRDVLNKSEILLEAYYQFLKDFLAELGSDVEELYPYKKLWENWQKYSKYGLLLACFILKIVLSEKQHIIDIGELLENSENPNHLNGKLVASSIYEQRVKDILVYYAETFL